MKTCSTRSLPCAVCGVQSDQHARWFLVVENAWLDRIKILSWHPALAEQKAMKSVCGKRHLKILITHWLTFANLRFVASRTPEFAIPAEEDAIDCQPELRLGGLLVRELAVHRESLSRLWSGSSEERETIFEVLIGGLQPSQPDEEQVGARTADSLVEALAVPHVAGAYLKEYATQ